MQITKEVDFAAAHSIKGAGQCANKHGHNWHAVIEVEHVGGEIADERGFLVDVRDLKNAAYKYDHDDLDKYFEFASTENVATKIAEDGLALCLELNPDAFFFVRVHLDETKNNSADAVATNATARLNESAFRLVGLEGAQNNEPHEFVNEDTIVQRGNTVRRNTVTYQQRKE